jgi:PAT family beta-lactamase induction signal transducer AmpG
VWVLLIAIGILSAMHDIACDGYYMDALSKHDQARYSGVRVAAFRAAMVVGSSGLVFFGGSIDWRLGFGAGAAIMLGLAVAHRVWLPWGESEVARQRAGRSSKEPRWGQIKEAYLSFLEQDRVVLVVAFLLTYKLADVVMFNMSKVLLARELGIPTDLRGLINAFSIGASIAGAIVGGGWIARRSLTRTLFPITLLMALTEPLYVLMASLGPELALSVPGTAETLEQLNLSAGWWKLATIGGIVITEQFCGGLATAAQMVFIMRRVHPEHKAAHFAFATAIYSTAQMLVGGESGQIYDALGSVNYFWFASALTLPAVVLAKLVPKD